MDDSVEAKIVELHFYETGVLQDALRFGRPSKSASELASCIEARTIQKLSISAESLSGEIFGEFGGSLS
jgi:hypothetical protein